MRRLVIQIDDDGAMTIEAPTDDPVTCFGMLKVAEDALRSGFIAAAQKQRALVEVPRLAPPNGFIGGK